jgi:acetyl-CoA/propionyl-CoA carboxylase biotin carboxyl carrier protein
VRAGAGAVAAPLAGTLVRVEVAEGDHVAAGDLLAVVEAMKMETPLRAPVAGTVEEVRAEPGAPVAADQVVLVIVAD